MNVHIDVLWLLLVVCRLVIISCSLHYLLVSYCSCLYTVVSVSCLQVGHHLCYLLMQFTLPSSELLLLFVVDRM